MSSRTQLYLLERPMKLVLEVFDDADVVVALAIVERPWVLYGKSMITLSLIVDKGLSLPPQAYAIDPHEPCRLTGTSEETSRPGARRHLREGRSLPTW
jgi:hypothetical protein